MALIKLKFKNSMLSGLTYYNGYRTMDTGSVGPSALKMNLTFVMFVVQ